MAHQRSQSVAPRMQSLKSKKDVIEEAWQTKKKCHHIVVVIIVVIVVVLDIVSWLCAVPRPKIIRSALVACGCFGSVLACGCWWSLGLSGCQWLPHERNHFHQGEYLPFSLPSTLRRPRA